MSELCERTVKLLIILHIRDRSMNRSSVLRKEPSISMPPFNQVLIIMFLVYLTGLVKEFSTRTRTRCYRFTLDIISSFFFKKTIIFCVNTPDLPINNHDASADSDTNLKTSALQFLHVDS